MDATKIDPGRGNVFVVVDAVRCDHVGVYDKGATELTPAIDELVAEGIVFEQAYTVTNATEPAMLTLFSGRYPTQTMLGHGRMITETERRWAWGAPLAPPCIQEAGYWTLQTGRSLGRWFDTGFDASKELLSRWEETSSTRLDEIRDRLESVVAKTLYRVATGVGGQIGSAYRSTPDQAATPIERLLERIDESSERPMFALTHQMDVHAG